MQFANAAMQIHKTLYNIIEYNVIYKTAIGGYVYGL